MSEQSVPSSYSRDLPIGRQMRRRARERADRSIAVTALSSLSALDRRIAALETAVYAASSSSSERDSDVGDEEEEEEEEEGEEEERPSKVCRRQDVVRLELDEWGGAVRLTSAAMTDEERIAPLPASLLPVALPSQRARQREVAPAKRARVSGLEASVEEMLRNYEPSAAERRPLWCRVCRFQGDSEEALLAHRLTDPHLAACTLERRLSSCKLCHKEFTSPDQLRNHVQGRPHKERLQSARDKQNRGRGGKR